MLGPDSFCITDRSQVEFLIPDQEFILERYQSRHLPLRQVDAKELLRGMDKFFHIMGL
jgi:hypothetical protein